MPLGIFNELVLGVGVLAIGGHTEVSHGFAGSVGMTQFDVGSNVSF
jgi:hypothetical protein